jgi:hypothetical protein
MKTGRISVGFAGVALTVALIGVARIQGQFFDSELCFVKVLNVQTTGGLTYVTAVSSIYGTSCFLMDWYFQQSDTNLTLTFAPDSGRCCPSWNGICPECPPTHYYVTNTEMRCIGLLPPGQYTMAVRFYPYRDPYGYNFNDLITLDPVTFDVSPNQEPFVRIRLDPGQVWLEAAGVSGILYHVQSSDDLKTWEYATSLYQAPWSCFLPRTRKDGTNSQTRFYRVIPTIPIYYCPH